MTLKLIMTSLLCFLFATSTLAQHNDRRFRFTIDLTQERDLIIEDGPAEFSIKIWPITLKDINLDQLCVCEKPDCVEIDSSYLDFGDYSQAIELAHYPTRQFNNALYEVFQKMTEQIRFTGSQFISQLFDFPITSWTFSPAHSLFEAAEADETLTNFDSGDVVFLSPTTYLRGLTNFVGTHFAIFLGKNALDGRPILLCKLGGEIFAIDLTTFTTLFPNAKHIFRLRWKNPRSEEIITVYEPSRGFGCL